MSAVGRRLDSLDARPSWIFARLLLLTGFSWALNAAEFVLFAKTRRPMAKSLHLRTNSKILVDVGVLLGAAVGGPLFGRIADSRGRRWALLAAKILSLAGLMLSAMATKDYELVAARILAGIGLGGELPVAATLVYELTPRSKRGRTVALLEAFSGVGGAVGVALALAVVPQFGWRVPYLSICSGMFYVGMLCLFLPESPRWLASSGRVSEALSELEKLERAHGTRSVYSRVMTQELLPEIETQESTAVTGQTANLSVFDHPVLAVLQWTLWVVMALSSYALGVYVPVLIGLWGFNMLSSWSTRVLLHLSQVVGSVLASLVLEKYALQEVLVCCTTSAAVVAVLLSHAPWNAPVVVVSTCTVSALLAASWSCLLVYTSRTFATKNRGRGLGCAFGFSRLSAVGGSWLYPHLFDVKRLSVPSIAWIFAGLLVAVVFGAFLHDRSANSDVHVPSEEKIKVSVQDVGNEGLRLATSPSSPFKLCKNE